MVFLKSWEDFESAAESMYLSNPAKCRYTMKYAHSKKCMVLKVTDNVKVSKKLIPRFIIIKLIMYF